ncbi:craniofacial development protein 2-like [Condylostylus longicornis]|uniref:craniofacial development protein 2-like n=1 Tax=Condylostylus longicornis TaxID=2530218 RepID=UPI00244DEA94|nr:craniofacial development protein 2-like [Condylostylus longicornis]
MINNEEVTWLSVSGSKRVLRIPGGKTNKNKAKDICTATWNIRSIYQAGKLANTVNEMKRLNIDILGISETWWAGSGECVTNGPKLYHSGNETDAHRRGVGVIIPQHLTNCVTNFMPESDRVMLLKINAKPLTLNIIQVYAPTFDKSEEEVEDFYAEVTKVLKLTRRHELNIIMGDFNAKVGDEKVENVCGNFGLGVRNCRGDRLVQYCQEQNLRIMNTYFKLPPRRLYTWKSPQDSISHIVRNQIDFILINNRFCTSVKGARTYPGADVPKDHNLLLAEIKSKLVAKPKVPQQVRLNLDRLKNENIRARAAAKINDQLRNIETEKDTQSIWNQTKMVLNNVGKENLGTKKYTAKRNWITEEILMLMEQRRSHRNKNTSEYKRINRIIRIKIRQAKITWLQQECGEIERLQHQNDAETRSFCEPRKN